MERKLTTIFASDVVGFSKMMGEDEVKTLKTLNERMSVIDKIIDENGGIIFGSAGDSVIAELENRIKVLRENSKQLEDDKIKTLKAEFDNLKENSEIYQKTNKKYEQTIRKQKEQILELKSAKLILEKEIKGQTKDTTPQNKSDGIIATFPGNLLYEPNKKRIILISIDGTEYTILQDDFPGDLVAKCGLPITTSSKDRCNVTILAELKVKGDELILKGKEIKEIKKNK